MNEQNVVTPSGFEVRSVPSGAQAFPLGSGPTGVGAVGDRLQRIVVNVATPANAALSLFDGLNELPLIFPNANVPQGPQQFEIGAYSRYGAWYVKTGSGISSCVAIGNFTR